MKTNIIVTIIILSLYGCALNKPYVTINNRNISITEYTPTQACFLYKNTILEGVYKIKYGKGEYIIANYKNGLLHGVKKSYVDSRLINEENYKEGLKNGDAISYSNGQIRTKITYSEGFIKGNFIWYNEDIPKDTNVISYYYSDSLGMSVYIDKMTRLFKNECLFELIDPCLIKTDKYPIRYYQKADSSLIDEVNWYKVGNCLYQSKKWGYTGMSHIE